MVGLLLAYSPAAPHVAGPGRAPAGHDLGNLPSSPSPSTMPTRQSRLAGLADPGWWHDRPSERLRRSCGRSSPAGRCCSAVRGYVLGHVFWLAGAPLMACGRSSRTLLSGAGPDAIGPAHRRSRQLENLAAYEHAWRACSVWSIDRSHRPRSGNPDYQSTRYALRDRGRARSRQPTTLMVARSWRAWPGRPCLGVAYDGTGLAATARLGR